MPFIHQNRLFLASSPSHGYASAAAAPANTANSLIPYVFRQNGPGQFLDPVAFASPYSAGNYPPGFDIFHWICIAGVATAGDQPTLLAVGMLGNASSDDYRYQLFAVSYSHIVSTSYLGTSATLNTAGIAFVNYMWASYDPVADAVTILSGDENANEDPLNAAIVQFSGVSTGKPTATLAILDVSAYTFGAFQSIQGKYFALSPGLVGDGPYVQHTWSLVEFSPSTGKILSAMPITPGAVPGSGVPTYLPPLNGRYAGGVTNGVTPDGLIIQYFFRLYDNVPLLAFIDPSSATIVWSTYISNHIPFDNLIYSQKTN